MERAGVEAEEGGDWLPGFLCYGVFIGSDRYIQHSWRRGRGSARRLTRLCNSSVLTARQLGSVLGKLGPGRLGPEQFFAANWAPADWYRPSEVKKKLHRKVKVFL